MENSDPAVLVEHLQRRQEVIEARLSPISSSAVPEPLAPVPPVETRPKSPGYSPRWGDLAPQRGAVPQPSQGAHLNRYTRFFVTYLPQPQ